jgi:hypothetical protein
MKMDGMPISMVRKTLPVDYVLRAMIVPGGEHTIEFKFEPQVIKRSTITLISAVGMLLLLGGGIYYEQEGIKEKRSEYNLMIIFLKVLLRKTYLKFNS